MRLFSRHYWNSKYAFASNDRLYKSFKDLLKINRVAPARDFLIELQSAAKIYKKIGDPSIAHWTNQKEQAVGRALILINQYKVTQVRPFLLALLDARDRKVITQTVFIRIVLNLEAFHFTFSNLCQERASGLEGTYTRSAKSLHLAGTDKVKAKEVISLLNANLIKKAPSKEKISASLKKLTSSKLDEGDKKTIQIIFRKVELLLIGTNELQPGNFSLEHIHDQAHNDDWSSYIGNLIPLDEIINSGIKAGATFKDKKKKYAKSSFKIVEFFLKENLQDSWAKADSEKWAIELGKKLAEATKLHSI